MTRVPRASFIALAAGGLSLFAASAARADIPTGYAGKPFDPVVAGGPKLPAGVKAGPYAVPGRLDIINYDMGGDGVAYHTGDHIAKGGAGYRVDGQTATLSWTGSCIPNVGNTPCTNVWYDTSPTLDGTKYPSPTTDDFSIGAVQNGDWFNITVNVQTAGTYSVSSTWASGEGPPGGEGGNGNMGAAIFSNGTMLATWSAIFPNYNQYADFHHWKAYPNFATVTLPAGLQVIKIQSKAKHLQMDYIELALVSGDGGVPATDGGAPPDGGATGAAGSGAGGTTGTGGATGAGGEPATGGTSGGAAGTGATGAAGDASGTGSAGAPGSTGAAGTGTGVAGATGGGTTGAAGTGVKGGTSKSGGGCAVAADAGAFGVPGLLLVVGLVVIVSARRRRTV